MKTISDPEKLTLVFSCHTDNCEQVIYAIRLSSIKNSILAQPCPECNEIMKFNYVELRE